MDPKRKRNDHVTESEPESKRLKIERFDIEEDINQWKLPVDLAEYVTK